MPLHSRISVLRSASAQVAFGALSLGIGIHTALSLAEDPALMNWSFTHWLFSYEYGFIKRGLAGELLSWFNPASGLDTLRLIALCSSVSVGVVLMLAFSQPFLRKGQAALAVFAILAMAHFATIQHFFYDVGRFDHMGLLLAVGCLCAIDRCGPAVTAIVVFVAGATGILIHEAFAVIHAPLVLAYWAVQRNTREPWQLRAGVTLGLLAVLAIVNAAGPPAVAQDEYVRLLRVQHGDWVSERSVSVLYGNLQADVSRSLSMLFTFRRLTQHLVLAVALLPSFALIARMVKNARLTATDGHSRLPDETIVLLAALTPLSLYVIGVDFARWWALAMTNVFLAISFIVARDERWCGAVVRTLSENRPTLWFVLLASLVTGPLGVAASPFPRLEPIINDLVLTVVRSVRG